MLRFSATSDAITTNNWTTFLRSRRRVIFDAVPSTCERALKMFERPNCFVIMGFGVKTDYISGRAFNLDKTYMTIIKPAVEAAGLECVRADETNYYGSLERPTIERLLTADVVVADLSTSNPSALYELGIRHALRPRTTIVIAERGFRSNPFALTAVPIRQYEHLGSDIAFAEVVRFREDLTKAIVTSLRTEMADSPIYNIVPGLKPPYYSATRAIAEPSETPGIAGEQSALMSQAEEALRRGDFQTARQLFTAVRATRNAESPERADDPHLVRRLALATYKMDLLQEARELLAMLEPSRSLDAETVGMWGAVHKRIWDRTHDGRSLDDAILAYERAFVLRNDHYNGINLAFLLNVRSTVAINRDDAVADFIQAERIRRRVIALADEAAANSSTPDDKYWALAAKAEAFLGIGDEAAAAAALAEAAVVSEAPWMVTSTEFQLSRLRRLLAQAPTHLR